MNGKLIKGHHPVLIDLPTFLKANELLKNAPTTGIAKTHRYEELPLKIFAKAEISGCPFTGYLKKGNWYYKTRNTSGKVNISAIKLNAHFKNLLSQFEYKKQYKAKLKKTLTDKLRKQLAESIGDTIQLKKRITELENQIEKVEERYILGNFKKELYEKYKLKYETEKSEIKQNLAKKSFDSSNLEKIVEKGIAIAENRI